MDKYDKEWYNELITDYKVLEMDLEWVMRDGTPILLKDMEDSHIKNCINMLKRRQVVNGNRLAWIYILENVSMIRRCLKINKIKNIINNG